MSAQLPVIRYREGDTLPLLYVQIERTDNVVLNYAQMSLRLRIARTGGGYLEKTAVLTDVDTGRFVFTWEAGDFLRGSHMGAVTVTDDAGRKLTSRNILFDVLPPIE